MLRSMYSGISGMKSNQVKLDVIGNNIANVSTTGFKSSSARFTDMLYQNVSSATAPTSTKGGTNAKQVGLGSQLASINKVMGQGNALSTGRSLDVCIDGDGYLIVGTGPASYGGDDGTKGGTSIVNGSISGGDMDILYTRDGNLTLDHEGNLLTADGYRVMGYYLTDGTNTSIKEGEVKDKDGNVIGTKPEANFVDADKKPTAVGAVDGKSGGTLQPLVIPDSVMKPKINEDGTEGDLEPVPVKSFSIGKDGVITAVLGDGSRAALGQVAMGSFKNPEGLTSVGGNLLEASSNSGPVIVKTSTGTTDGDNSKGFGDFIQGALEASNVDLTEQFTDMITATRAFQASSKMISTADEILQTITGLMR
ncbi:flagellar hook-basal body complex protein [Clostridium botulinum]|uniref:flagellar hook-basal body complex protein n=1 Tax=Clostridium botulinum TaxID=1491 RepID=UPI0013F05630|nr:flagellar hook-basal body complex protein [Clostridium botulinum]MBN1041204.1 flagellar hook-basal body complex protein [Clostridium botulinum]MBN1047842.1 flagellar hook-basal body complex protein [Clostridium botulinum]MBN1076803.1 flagellar hook-basal body complex protein [Clostridium botulinum]MBY6917310.1 flagellar hook-basal body complex protein [Clostridium botulinum]NFH90492.1 flagellar hook-basal body complex protein [Clostridium botulinum]